MASLAKTVFSQIILLISLLIQQTVAERPSPGYVSVGINVLLALVIAYITLTLVIVGIHICHYVYRRSPHGRPAPHQAEMQLEPLQSGEGVEEEEQPGEEKAEEKGGQI